MERGSPTTELRGMNAEEIALFIRSLAFAERTDVASRKGGSLLLVSMPPGADFIQCGLRLRQLIREHATSLAHHDLADIQIILVRGDGQSFKIEESTAQVPIGDVQKVYCELNTSTPKGRITIWIVPRENAGSNTNAFAELGSVIALKGQEVVLAPNTNSQANSWPDFWSRRSRVLEIFQ